MSDAYLSHISFEESEKEDDARELTSHYREAVIALVERRNRKHMQSKCSTAQRDHRVL